MEHLNKKMESQKEKVPGKKDRLEAIARLILEAKPAASAEEANELVRRSFKAVEDPLDIDDAEKMEAHRFDVLKEMSHKDKKIYFGLYISHILFLGENGSIDIRMIDRKFPVTERLLEKQPLFPQAMKLFLEKAGADGQKVWD